MTTLQQLYDTLGPMTEVRCPGCTRMHEVDAETLQEIGPNVPCKPCTDNAHVLFMRTTGKMLDLVYVKDCHCGMGS